MKPTVEDWLELARSETSDAEWGRYVDEATAHARDGWEWAAVLRAVAEPPVRDRERVRSVAERTLRAATPTNGGVWAFRTVAEVRATVLGDDAGARAALALGERVLAGSTGSLVILADGFAESIGDERAARQCLDAARDRARAERSVDGLCGVALALAKRDPEAALALVEEADRANDAGAAWTLANTWRSLGRDDAAGRVLDAASASARTTRDAVHVVRAWSSHGDDVGVARALVRARALASDARDWLDVAEVAFDAACAPAVVRSALEQATAMAGDDDVRGRIASAWVRCLGDVAAADRVGPRGVRPAALSTPYTRLAGWTGSASGLFDVLRARVSPEQLLAIASRDYGSDVDRHLAALVDICETGRLPRAFAWHPGEVLELERWSIGTRVDHLSRALCCTLLCLVPGPMGGRENTLPPLVESALILGSDVREHAEQLCVWICEAREVPPGEVVPDDDDDGPDVAALLALILLRAAVDPGDPRIAGLVQRLADHPWSTPSLQRALLGESLRADLWNQLFDDLLVPVRGDHISIDALLRSLRP